MCGCGMLVCHKLIMKLKTFLQQNPHLWFLWFHESFFKKFLLCSSNFQLGNCWESLFFRFSLGFVWLGLKIRQPEWDLVTAHVKEFISDVQWCSFFGIQDFSFLRKTKIALPWTTRERVCPGYNFPLYVWVDSNLVFYFPNIFWG